RIQADVNKRDLKEIAKILKEKFGAHLSMITCRDAGKEFEVIYHFDINGNLLNLKTLTSKAISKVPSIISIFPVADFYEREIMDLFGVKFEGHPKPRRFILPDNWPKNVYPLRKR
ncbi:MAG: hydrogenase large subunit, partial [Thermoprotei archaeon]